jgi:hypothetical protein
VARRCVIKKPREREGHSPRWVAVLEKINNNNNNNNKIIFYDRFFLQPLAVHISQAFILSPRHKMQLNNLQPKEREISCRTKGTFAPQQRKFRRLA